MSLINMRLDLYSHNVKVSDLTPLAEIVIKDFARTLAEVEVIKKERWDSVRRQRITYYEKSIKKVFAASGRDRDWYRFHINSLPALQRHLSYHGIHEENIEYVIHPMYTPDNIKLKVIDKREPREDQIESIDYLSTSSPIKVLTLQTGKGKTFCSNHAINNISQRTVIIIKGMYEKRWIDDINQTFEIKKGDLIVVRGNRDLIKLIELAKHDALDAKIIIITNTTFRMYLQHYELYPDIDMYGCQPIDFFKTLKAGIRLIDEVHQDFHLNFKIDLYTHIPTCINLSATLVSDSDFITNMYMIAFPLAYRSSEVVYDKYIAVKAYMYKFNDIRRLRYKQKGRTSYSHVVFEESIMKERGMLSNYCDMIADITYNTFINDYVYGQKFIIFCATVELCSLVTNYLKLKYPKVIISKYTSEDDASVLDESDVIVSTLKSAGTAVDISGLKKALMTVAVGSRQANEQAVGRLRKLREWPDITPEFIYLVCPDIEKHMTYHYHKQEVLSDKILSLTEVQTHYRI